MLLLEGLIKGNSLSIYSCSGGGEPRIDSCLFNAGGLWLSQLLQSGSISERSALATAVELSLRSNHPVSQAMALCGERALGQLPDVDIANFISVPGELDALDWLRSTCPFLNSEKAAIRGPYAFVKNGGTTSLQLAIGNLVG